MSRRFPVVSSVAAVLVVLLALACSAPSPGKKKPAVRTVALFATAELRGTIEPCGCNSDPLGDIARTVELIEATRRAGTPVLVIDGGSLLYSEPRVPDYLSGQEALKSDLITRLYAERLNVAAIGLGPYDLGAGADRVRPARHAVNLPPDSGIPTTPPTIIDAGGVTFGVFGVVAPASLTSFGLEPTDPGPAARAAIAGLRKQGAQVVVGLAHMTWREATSLAKDVPGIDFLLVAQNAPEPGEIRHAATQVGDTYLFAPANRGQIVSRLDITWRDPGSSSNGAGASSSGFTDAVGETRAAIEISELEGRIAKLGSDLATWSADPEADADFVAAKKQELAELTARDSALKASPLMLPAQGSYFTLSQLRIRRALACNTEVVAAKTAYDQAAGQANAKAAASIEPRAPAPGKAGYVGAAACEDCHDEAVAFWKKTRHHDAWETLETLGKQLDYQCISCHVTGWDEPGGATLAKNDTLRDVQCETCHGPGSMHVAEDGADEPVTVVRAPPETLCKTCHNKEHSDTFEFTAYLRNVTGPGHGEEYRKNLGDGPTGRELRSAALEKAGRSLGAGCKK